MKRARIAVNGVLACLLIILLVMFIRNYREYHLIWMVWAAIIVLLAFDLRLAYRPSLADAPLGDLEKLRYQIAWGVLLTNIFLFLLLLTTTYFSQAGRSTRHAETSMEQVLLDVQIERAEFEIAAKMINGIKGLKTEDEKRDYIEQVASQGPEAGSLLVAVYEYARDRTICNDVLSSLSRMTGLPLTERYGSDPPSAKYQELKRDVEAWYDATKKRDVNHQATTRISEQIR